MPWLERSKGGGVSATLSASSSKIDEAYLHLNTLSNDKQTFINPKDIDIYFGANYPESQLNVKTDDRVNYFPVSPGLTTCKLTIKHSDGAISTASFKHGAEQKSPLDSPYLRVNDYENSITFDTEKGSGIVVKAFFKDNKGLYTEAETTVINKNYHNLGLPSPPLIRNKVYFADADTIDWWQDDDMFYYIDIEKFYAVSKEVNVVDSKGVVVDRDVRYYREFTTPVSYGDPVWCNMRNLKIDPIVGNLAQDMNTQYQLHILTKHNNSPMLSIMPFDLTIPNSGGVEITWRRCEYLREGDNTNLADDNISIVGGAVVKSVDGAPVGWRPLEGGDFLFSTPYPGTNSYPAKKKFKVTRESDFPMDSFEYSNPTIRLYAKDIYETYFNYFAQSCDNVATHPHYNKLATTRIKSDDIDLVNTPVKGYTDIRVGTSSDAELYIGREDYRGKFIYNLSNKVSGGRISYLDLRDATGEEVPIPVFDDTTTSENMLASKTLTTDLASDGTTVLSVKSGEEISMEVDTSDDRVSGANVKLWVGIS